MEQIDKQYICYTCIGCNRLATQEFQGVYRCNNYIKKERAKEEVERRRIFN